MTTRLTFPALILLPLALALPTANAAGSSAVAAGARFHSEQPGFTSLPCADGDISYGAAYEYHEEMGYWRLGVNYTPKVTGTNAVSTLITPEIDLMFKDGIWRLGVGVLRSYQEFDDGEADWSDFYWQFAGGVGLPMFGVSIEVLAYYPFDTWSHVFDEFDGSRIEFGVWVGLTF